MNVKRYDLGTVYHGSIGTPGIIEQAGGRYVLASDYDELAGQMEAVGAGGVSALMGAQQDGTIITTAGRAILDAALQAQQDADKVDAQPCSKCNGAKGWERKTSTTTGPWIDCPDCAAPVTEQPDPVMAGNEWLDRLCKLVLAYKDSIFIDTEDFLATRKTAYEAVINHARKRVQPASGNMVDMVDAAMVEMQNLHPPMRRSECERLIRAALKVQPANGATE